MHSGFKITTYSKQKIIRDEGKAIYSTLFNLKDTNFPWGSTGGSTGEPLKFPRGGNSQYNFEHLLQRYLLQVLIGWKDGENIVSIDGQIPDNMQLIRNIYYRTQNNFPYGKYHFSSLHLSKDTLKYFYKDISQFKPSILRGYPSSLGKLARLMDDEKLRFDFPIKGAYVTSEVMSYEDEQYIRKVFNAPIFGQYGHCETSIFAISPDGDSKYYASPLYGYTEILNPETKEHVEIGEVGEIVVTGFSNYALPFIRYCTGDMGRYDGINDKGELIIGKLQGRSVD